MKKKIFGVAAVALAGALCLGLCACGAGGVGATVSEKQWEAAFDEILREDEKFTASGTYTRIGPLSTNMDPSTVSDWSVMWTQDSGNLHMTGNADIVGLFQDGAVTPFAERQHWSTEEMYLEKCSDGSKILYTKVNSGEWRKGATDADAGTVTRIDGLAKDCKGNYALFAYDAERKGYTITEAADSELRGRLGTMVVRFDKAGKLVSFGGEVNLFDSTNCSFEFTITYTAEEMVFPEVE